jgi:hypothetical protein
MHHREGGRGMNVDRMTQRTQEALGSAQQMAMTRGHNAVEALKSQDLTLTNMAARSADEGSTGDERRDGMIDAEYEEVR